MARFYEEGAKGEREVGLLRVRWMAAAAWSVSGISGAKLDTDRRVKNGRGGRIRTLGPRFWRPML